MRIDRIELRRHVRPDILEGVLRLLGPVHLDDELARGAPGGLEHGWKAYRRPGLLERLGTGDLGERDRIPMEVAPSEGFARLELASRVQRRLAAVADPVEALAELREQQDVLFPEGDGSVEGAAGGDVL